MRSRSESGSGGGSSDVSGGGSSAGSGGRSYGAAGSGSGAGRHTGRRPAGGDTRATILKAARDEFASLGYGQTSVAAIARRAACDPALVHYFFGTKRELFEEAVSLPYDPGEILVSALKGERRDGLGARLVEFALSRWETGEGHAVMLALLRSASSEDDAREAVHDLMVRRALLPAVNALGVPDAERRAVLIGALIIGLLLVRHVVCMEPLASDPRETVALALGPVVERYLFDDLGVHD